MGVKAKAAKRLLEGTSHRELAQDRKVSIFKIQSMVAVPEVLLGRRRPCWFGSMLRPVAPVQIQISLAPSNCRAYLAKWGVLLNAFIQ